jgi:hypothetical protein
MGSLFSGLGHPAEGPPRDPASVVTLRSRMSRKGTWRFRTVPLAGYPSVTAGGGVREPRVPRPPPGGLGRELDEPGDPCAIGTV